MLEMRAIVIRLQGDDAYVQPLGKGGCGHCETEGGCGSGTLSKLFCNNTHRQFSVSNRACASVGDEVNVSIPDGTLLRGAMKMYMLPLVLLLTGGFVGASVTATDASHDAYAVFGATVGLLLGFLFARLVPSKGKAVAVSVLSTRSVS